jgi:hypothetical protein
LGFVNSLGRAATDLGLAPEPHGSEAVGVVIGGILVLSRNVQLAPAEDRVQDITDVVLPILIKNRRTGTAIP